MIDIELRPMHENGLKGVSELALLANPHAEEGKFKKHIVDELREVYHCSLMENAFCGCNCS